MTSSQLLGFPPDARVLILNCDDLGMHRCVNVGVLQSIQAGVASSCSLMTPCPAAAEAMQMLRRAPDVPFGVHLTLTRDTSAQRWSPIARRDDVPSLVNEDGLLFTNAAGARLLAQARLEDVEREFTAQIDVVARGGLVPTHLDWHALADGGRPDIFDLTVALARHHGLAVRVWLEQGQRLVRGSGLPVIDHPFLDSFALDVPGKAERYVQLLRALPPGLSEWAVHPALVDEATPEHDLGWAIRRSDHAFLTSPLARRVLEEEHIVVISYRDLQDRWSPPLLS